MSIALSAGETPNIAAEIEKNVFGAAQERKESRVARLGQLLDGAITEYEKRSQNGGESDAIFTGLKDLDRKMQGFRPGQLIVLAARPGMGKTAFTLSLAKNAAVKFNKPVAFFSLEMSSIQLVNRMISSETEISTEKLRKGELADYEWQQLNMKVTPLTNAPIYIDDTPALSVFELRAQYRD